MENKTQEITILSFEEWCVREKYMFVQDWQLYPREDLSYQEWVAAKDRYIEYFKWQKAAMRKLESEKKKAEQVALMK